MFSGTKNNEKGNKGTKHTLLNTDIDFWHCNKIWEVHRVYALFCWLCKEGVRD